MTQPNHPSAFALDVAALGTPGPELAEHLAACARCRAHLASSAPSEAAVPAWVHETRKPWWSRLAPWPVLGAVAASVFVALVFRAPAPSDDSPDVTRAKGLPSFAIYVEHQGAVRLWDGHAPLSAGDRLQLKVAPAEFGRLVVGVETTEGWALLFEGAVKAHGETVLPESWLVDAKDRQQRLGLLLCAGACGAQDLSGAARAKVRDASRWWTEFRLEHMEQR